MKERKAAYLNRYLWIISKHLRSGYEKESFYLSLSEDKQNRPGDERAISQVVVAKIDGESSLISSAQVRVWKIFDRGTYNSLHRLYPQISRRGNSWLDRVVIVQLMAESTFYGRTADNVDVFTFHLPIPGRYVVAFDWKAAKSPFSNLKGESVMIWVSDDLAFVHCFLEEKEVWEELATDDVKVSIKQSVKPLSKLGDMLHRGIQQIFKFTGR